MSRHILVVEVDTDYAERFPAAPPSHRWRIECPEGNGCAGFEECAELHPEGADDGPYGSEDAPWFDQDEYVFHGVLHTWHGCGYGWTVPYKGCVVQGSDVEPPDDLYLSSPDRELPLGRWVVEDDWEDYESVYLRLVGPA